MISDTERREVARRLREAASHYESMGRDVDFYPVESALGLKPAGETAYAPESVRSLADLIDPDESGQNQDTNPDTVQKESPAVQKAPKCDRDALLALADKMSRYARLRSSSGMDVDAMAVGAWVCRIREACGEVVG